jgi:hypothetical protein
MTRRPSALRQLAVPNRRSWNSFRSFRQASVGVLVLIATMFGGAIEATACGTELDMSISVEFVDLQSPTKEENRSVDQHGVCAHGHCHHGQHATAIHTKVSQTMTGSIGVLLSNDDYLTDTDPNLLKRPPRA